MIDIQRKEIQFSLRMRFFFDEAEYKNHLSELGLRNCDYHSALDVQKYFTAFSSKLVMEPLILLMEKRQSIFQ